MSNRVTIAFDMSDYRDELGLHCTHGQDSAQALAWFVRCLICRGNATDFDPRDLLMSYLSNNFGDGFIYREDATRIFEEIARNIRTRLPGYSPYDESIQHVKTSEVGVTQLGYVYISMHPEVFHRWVKP